MKIILSRKGFDSIAGGIPSPIFPNGDIISFPIPNDDDSDKYSDLQYKYNGKNYKYTEILKDLYECNKTELSKKMLKEINSKHCHLDPDIDKERRIKCPDNWEPLFGQINQAGKYLKTNIKDNEDYLFLFFGWFRYVEFKNNKFQYEKGENKDLQVIWGYLLVNEMITDCEIQSQKTWHPHSKEYRTENNNNVIFTAKKAGIFNKLEEKLILTDKNKTRAVWKYREVYSPEKVLPRKDRSLRKNCALDKQNNIYYKGQWQELFLENSDLCRKWAEEILPKGVL